MMCTNLVGVSLHMLIKADWIHRLVGVPMKTITLFGGSVDREMDCIDARR